MTEKPRIFIYDRREMAVLLLLGVMVAVFAFTLGVHLGKRVGGKAAPGQETETAAVNTATEKLPESKEIAEQAKSAGQVADDSMNQALHDEVDRTGVKLDAHRQMDLPSKAKTANAGATTAPGQKAPPAQASAAEHIRYTLQVGSYPKLAEARSRAKGIEDSGLKTQVQEAEIRGKGKWFRIYIGEFGSRLEAEKAGRHYQEQKLIDSFVVAKSGAPGGE